VIDASPARLDRLLSLQPPVVRVRYRFMQRGGPPLESLIIKKLQDRGPNAEGNPPLTPGRLIC
jgi:hypothetical protein